jgi:hypothetical protein
LFQQESQVEKMVEKRQLVYDLRLSYNGPLSIEGFYAEVEKWMEEKGLTKEIKKSSEELTTKGKRIEWVVECWKSMATEEKYEIRLRALFDKVRDVKRKKKGRSITISEADALFVIDTFIETKFLSRWTEKPLNRFFRTLFDKYIWNIVDTNDSHIIDESYDLHKRIKAYLNIYKMKVE